MLWCVLSQNTLLGFRVRCDDGPVALIPVALFEGIEIVNLVPVVVENAETSGLELLCTSRHGNKRVGLPAVG